LDFNTLSRVRILAKLEPIVDPSILGKESKRYLKTTLNGRRFSFYPP